MTRRKKEFNIAMKSHITELLSPLIILIVDYAMVMLSELMAYLFRAEFLPIDGKFSLDAIYVYAIIPLVYLFFLYGNSDSIIGQPFWQTARRTFWRIIYSTVAITVVIYLQHIESGSLSRIFLLSTGVFSVIFVISGRYFLRKEMGKYSLFQIPILFIGAGKTAEKLIFSMNSDVGFGYRIIGFIDDNPASKLIANQYRILGRFDQAEKIVRRLRVRYVVIAAPGISQEKQIRLVNSIQPYVKSVSFVPNFWGAPGNLSIVSLADAGMMLIQAKNNLANWHNRLLKRVFDIVCCIVGLCITWPVFLAIAVAIVITNPGPIIFSHKRVGKDGKIFPCYKFRSMIVDSERVLKEYLAKNPVARREWEENFKLKDDPRITKIGAFLRKTSLDELPQIFNVLKGDMSLVGPRPIVTAEIKKYGEYFRDFSMVLPGITGVWQVNGRSDTTYEQRVMMDSWYVHNWSIWMDMWYLVKTFKVVIYHEGAY